MPLSPRQELAYGHLCDLYKPAHAIAADGKVGPETYTLEYEDVRCRFVVRQSPSSPSPMGRVESDIVLSIDEVLFSEDQEIDDGWWIQNKSLRPDGSVSNANGRWWVVRGEPRKYADTETRDGGRVSVMASQEPRPPAGLPL